MIILPITRVVLVEVRRNVSQRYVFMPTATIIIRVIHNYYTIICCMPLFRCQVSQCHVTPEVWDVTSLPRCLPRQSPSCYCCLVSLSARVRHPRSPGLLGLNSPSSLYVVIYLSLSSQKRHPGSILTQPRNKTPGSDHCVSNLYCVLFVLTNIKDAQRKNVRTTAAGYIPYRANLCDAQDSTAG